MGSRKEYFYNSLGNSRVQPGAPVRQLEEPEQLTPRSSLDHIEFAHTLSLPHFILINVNPWEKYMEKSHFLLPSIFCFYQNFSLLKTSSF